MLNSSESSLSLLPLGSPPPLHFPFRFRSASGSPLGFLLSLRVSLSVSFSRFGFAPLPWDPSRTPSRASLVRISKKTPAVNPFFEKNLQKIQENQRFRTFHSLFHLSFGFWTANWDISTSASTTMFALLTKCLIWYSKHSGSVMFSPHPQLRSQFPRPDTVHRHTTPRSVRASPPAEVPGS